jgi:hypothetical protein
MIALRHAMSVCTCVWMLGDDGMWECWHRVSFVVWVNTNQRRKTKPTVVRPKHGHTEWRQADNGEWQLWRREIQSRWQIASAQGEKPTVCSCGSTLFEDADGYLRPTHSAA